MGLKNFPRLTAAGLALVMLAVALPLSGFAHAQMVPDSAPAAAPVEIPENLTREQVRDLLARLSDDQVRELIISQLDKKAGAADQASVAEEHFQQLSTGINAARMALTRTFDSGEQLHALPSLIWQQISVNGQISGTFLLFQLIGLMLAGFAAEYLAKRQFEKSLSDPQEIPSLEKRFDLACYGAAMGLVELGVFAVGAILFVEIFGQQTPAAQELWYQVIWCLLLIKLVLLAVRQVAAPASPNTRLVSISDSAARQTWGWTLVLSSTLLLPMPIVRVAADFGASPDTVLLIRILAGVIFVGLVIALVVRLRHYGAGLIAGDDDEVGIIQRALARIWWVLTILYVLAVWFMSVGKIAATGESTLVPGMGSLLLFASIPYLDKGLRWLVSYYFDARDEETESTPATEPASASEAAIAAIEASTEAAIALAEASTGPETGADDAAIAQQIEPQYKSTALRYARVLMVLMLLAIFVRLWDINLEAITAILVGERFASALFDIGLTILLAWALWGVIRISIERKLVDEKGPEGDTGEAEAGGLGGTRTETILPLIRVFIKITIVVMTVMLCLSALGVNIGPMLAGAGVIGIAVGFGAQTLVRDIVSGFFYLIDDAFRIGEYVVIDQIRGTVEKISIRSFQLRHHNGPVHTIPYGEIRSLTNWSRDWAIMKFELRIPFETDIDMVRKTIKQIGIEMMQDPLFGPLMLAPVKSQGVNRMDDSALIIRCKFTAVPGQQFLIRREAFTRIQRVFEEKGIQFAPRRVLVESTTPQEAVNAAAAVLDQEIPESGEGQKPKSDQL